MGLGSDQLIASPEPLYGFTDDAVIPLGHIKLPLTVGDLDHEVTVITDFLIINSPSAYNIVIGKPAMNDLNLIISTMALVIKFPTLKGTRCVRGKQYSTRSLL